MYMYPECGIMEFRGRSQRNSIIPHKGYNPYILENHSTADLYYDATKGAFLPYFTTCMQLGCMLSYTLGSRVYKRLLVYMGFVLVVFPLKCGFIIVQLICRPTTLLISGLPYDHPHPSGSRQLANYASHAPQLRHYNYYLYI
jgi:hypothetical protein